MVRLSSHSEIIRPLNGQADLSRVETLPGAAFQKRLPVWHARRQISWGLLGAIQSGSPPVPASDQEKPRSPTGEITPNAKKKEKLLNTPCWGLSTSLVKAIRVCARFLSTSTPWRAQPGSFFRTIS